MGWTNAEEWDSAAHSRFPTNSVTKTHHFYLKTTVNSSRPLKVLFHKNYAIIIYPTTIAIVNSDWNIIRETTLFAEINDACICCEILFLIISTSRLVGLSLENELSLDQLINTKICDQPIQTLSTEKDAAALLVTGLQTLACLAKVTTVPMVPSFKEHSMRLADGERSIIFFPLNIGKDVVPLMSTFFTSDRLCFITEKDNALEFVDYDFGGTSDVPETIGLPHKIPLLMYALSSGIVILFEDEIVVVYPDAKRVDRLASLDGKCADDGNTLLYASLCHLNDTRMAVALLTDGTLLLTDLSIAEGSTSLPILHQIQSNRSDGQLVLVPNQSNEARVLLVSATGDLQMFRCISGQLSLVDDERLSRLVNTAPVMDFKLADLHRVRDDTLVLASGFRRSGSLRDLRNGITSDCSLEVPGDFSLLRNVWSLGKYLLLSFTTGSRVVSSCSDSFLEDETGQSGIEASVPTICADLADDQLVQVHSSGISISGQAQRFPQNTHLAALSDGTLIRAISSSDFDCVSLKSKSQLWSLEVAQECSCIHATQVHNQSVLMIGTYRPALLVYTIADDRPPKLLKERLIAQDSPAESRVPNSISTLEVAEGQSFVLIGLRDGKLLSTICTPNFDHHAFRERRLGIGPVKLVPSKQDDQCFAICDGICYHVYVHGSGLGFSKIFHKNVVGVAAMEEDIIIVTKTLFRRVKLGPNRYSVGHINLSETPRRLLYDHASKLILVALTRKSQETGGLCSRLQVVDPIEGPAQTLDVGNPKTDQEGDKQPARTEAVFAMTAWNPWPWKKLIVVGTAVYDSSGNVIGGRLLLYTLKKSGSTLEQVGIVSDTLPGAVLAICSVQDSGSLLLVASDRFVYAFSVGPKERKFTEVARLSARWTVTCISCVGNDIAIGCKRDSVSQYRLEHGESGAKFIYQGSDVVTRTISDCIMLQNKVIVAADRMGNLFGLFQRKSVVEHYLEEVFCIGLPSAIVRLQTGTTLRMAESSSTRMMANGDSFYGLRPSLDGMLSPVIESSPKISTDGILEVPQPVHAVSVLGDVYTLYTISPNVYYPLQILQKQLQRAWHKRTKLDHSRTRGMIYRWHNVIDGEFVQTCLSKEGCDLQHEEEAMMSLEMIRNAIS